MDDDFITIARVAKVQGRRGEVAADNHTDFPERFEERRRLFALTASGRRELHVDEHWMHKGRIVLKFAGIESITEAEALVGAELQVPRNERVALEAASVYLSDLVGCAVVDRDRDLGRITDVQFGTGEAPLLVVAAVRSSARELLIPFAAEYIQRIDIAANRIDMALPEGMLELDAPLTEEEKREQREQS
ncbi:MAG: 16S rRNA processing protein RimM [Acidobacteria bacterium]|nr:16S rRNA processing protein RimM [Acidobacteriota bacterium]